MDKTESLLPWFINHTLSEEEKNAVEVWLQSEPNSELSYQTTQQLSLFIRAQEIHTPSSKARTHLIAKVQDKQIQSNSNLHTWIWGGPLTLLIFILLWFIVQPGTQLEWSTSGNTPAAFRIYRAPVGSTQFNLIEELPASSTQQTYQFADLFVVPWRNYQYIIEARDQIGNTTISQAAMSNSLMTFASQIAILLTSFMLTFGIITVKQEIKSYPNLHLTVQ